MYCDEHPLDEGLVLAATNRRLVGSKKAIAYAPLGLNVERLLRIIPQLLPQAAHEDFKIVRIPDVLWPPDLLE